MLPQGLRGIAQQARHGRRMRRRRVILRRQTAGRNAPKLDSPVGEGARRHADKCAGRPIRRRGDEPSYCRQVPGPSASPTWPNALRLRPPEELPRTIKRPMTATDTSVRTQKTRNVKTTSQKSKPCAAVCSPDGPERTPYYVLLPAGFTIRPLRTLPAGRSRRCTIMSRVTPQDGSPGRTRGAACNATSGPLPSSRPVVWEECEE